MVGMAHMVGAQDAERVQAAIAAAERRTHARFVLVLVPASDHYALYPLLWAALIALAAGGLLAGVRPEIGLPLGFLLQAVLFLALSALLHLWPLRLALVPRHAKHLAAARLAHREFAVHVVGHGSERNGVLLFLSLGERYVEILADREIHGKVPEGSWDEIVAALVRRLKQGEVSEAVAAAIESCAALLEKHYPRAAGEQS